MHILFTRPLEDCKEIMVKFQLLGHEVSHMPLIYVEKKNYDEIDFKSFKAIIFTSSNAIKFLNLKKIDKKINCFCVGSATEKKARNFGFQNQNGKRWHLTQRIGQKSKTNEPFNPKGPKQKRSQNTDGH